MYYIYEVQFIKTGKTYVGQRKCPKNKTLETDFYMGSGKVIRDFFAKHHNYNGWEKTILQVCESKEEADELEKYWIAKRKSEGKAEYNFALGGDGNPLAYYDEQTEKNIRKISRQKANETIANWSDEKRREVREKKQKAWREKRARDDYWKYTEKQSKSHTGIKQKHTYVEAMTEEQLAERSKRVKATWAAKTEDELQQMSEKMKASKDKWSDEKRKAIYKSFGQPGETNPNYGKTWWNNGERNLGVPKGELPPEGFVKGMVRKKHSNKKWIWITDGKVNKCINSEDEIPEGFRRGRTKGV